MIMLKEEHSDHSLHGSAPHPNSSSGSCNTNGHNGGGSNGSGNGPVSSNGNSVQQPCNTGNAICSGCGQRILDRYYVLAVDRQWHNECLKCHSCAIVLSNQLTCFARDGLILCKEDYYRTFQQIPRRGCARCGNTIASQELIMRAKDLVYHLNCFVCVVCLRVLNKGDRFGMRHSALYCQKHYEMLIEEDSTGSSPPPQPQPPGPMSGGSPHLYPPHPGHHLPQSGHAPFFNGAGTGQKGRPRKRKDADSSVPTIMELGSTTPPAMQHLTQNLEMMGGDGSGIHVGGPRLEGYDSSSSANCPSGGGGQQRTKRMRTSFKHHQLRTMKSYFAINQNPDAKDLKQLAQKTGLSKRVLQVWFQNARAKWRRNMLRSESGKSDYMDPGGATPTGDDDLQLGSAAMSSASLDMLSTGGSDDGGFSSDVY